MGQEKHGTGETWDRRNIWDRREQRCSEETWDMSNVGQEKHGTGETRDRRSMEQEKLETG